MSTERLAVDANEQLGVIPDTKSGILISKNIYKGLTFLLESYGIKVNREHSSFRLKTPDRVIQKIARRGAQVPIRDIYGIRLITEEANRELIAKLIVSAYPRTPPVFPDGKLRVRDYSDPVVRQQMLEKYNHYSSSFYSALHINIAFLREGCEFYDIAEVQVMNLQELEIYNQTRQEYEQKRLSK